MQIEVLALVFPYLEREVARILILKAYKINLASYIFFHIVKYYLISIVLVETREWLSGLARCLALI